MENLNNMERYARQQVRDTIRPPVNPDNKSNSLMYNLWHHRWLGEGSVPEVPERPPTKLDLKRDIGWTRGATNPEARFCIHFAHGRCKFAESCSYLHRLPTQKDEIETMFDCFGRERFRTDRFDMAGTGNFTRDIQTLFVEQLPLGFETEEEMEELIREHFEPFGEIERVRVFTQTGVAFIKYKLRSVSEFAKEAMQGQDVGNEEVINIKWAYEEGDATELQERDYSRKRRFIEAQIAHGELPKMALELIDEEAARKRARLEEGVVDKNTAAFGGDDDMETTALALQVLGANPNFLAPTKPGEVIGQYPNTDLQYMTAGEQEDYFQKLGEATGRNPEDLKAPSLLNPREVATIPSDQLHNNEEIITEEKESETVAEEVYSRPQFDYVGPMFLQKEQSENIIKEKEASEITASDDNTDENNNNSDKNNDNDNKDKNSEQPLDGLTALMGYGDDSSSEDDSE